MKKVRPSSSLSFRSFEKISWARVGLTPEVVKLVGSKAGDLPPLEEDAPGVGGVETAYHVNQGRLARTIRPNQDGDLLLFHIESHPVEGSEASKRLRYVSCFQQLTH